jgi:hypothetical protein
MKVLAWVATGQIKHTLKNGVFIISPEEVPVILQKPVLPPVHLPPERRTILRSQ